MHSQSLVFCSVHNLVLLATHSLQIFQSENRIETLKKEASKIKRKKNLKWRKTLFRSFFFYIFIYLIFFFTIFLLFFLLQLSSHFYLLFTFRFAVDKMKNKKDDEKIRDTLTNEGSKC